MAIAISGSKDRAMSISIKKMNLQAILLITPVIGFMSVVDQSNWPFLAALTLPVVLARYLPSKNMIFSLDTRQDQLKSGRSSVKFIHLVIVGLTIFTLNMIPKKLEVKECNYELAGKIDQTVTPQALTPVMILLHNCTRTRIYAE
jgi:hypothetical protein